MPTKSFHCRYFFQPVIFAAPPLCKNRSSAWIAEANAFLARATSCGVIGLKLTAACRALSASAGVGLAAAWSCAQVVGGAAKHAADSNNNHVRARRTIVAQD